MPDPLKPPNPFKRAIEGPDAFQRVPAPDDRAAVTPDSRERYMLRLFVSGMTPRSARAVAAIRTICEEHLAGRYDLEVIDIYQQPELATADQVIAVPTLVKRLPEPLRRLIGDLTDTDRVLVGLGLQRK